MDTDTIIGLLVIFGAVALIAFLVFWSRRSIDRIADNGFGSAREITRNLRRDR